MKMKSFAALLSTLAFATAALPASASEATYQVQEVPNVLSEQIYLPPHGGEITPQDLGGFYNFTPSGQSTVQNPFSVAAGFGHVKMALKNNSNFSVNVSLTRGSTPIFNMVLGPKNSTTTESYIEWKSYQRGYPNGLPSGNYTLTWSGGSQNVNGTAWVKTASTTVEVQ